MKVSVVILLCTVFCLVICNKETFIIDIIKETVQNLFRELFCVYLITGTKLTPGILNRIFFLTNIPMYTILYNVTYNYTNKLLQCNGYILSGFDQMILEQFLYRDVHVFKPHSRILIILTPQNNWLPKFTSVADSRALDVLGIVDVEKVLNLKGKNFYITSFIKNQTIVCNYKKCTKNKDVFIKTNNWIPKIVENSSLIVSAFNCSPYVILNDKEEVIDGIDYRIVKEIMGNIKIKFKTYSKSDNKTNMWYVTSIDVLQEKSDLAICSHWQLHIDTMQVDMTKSYGQVCVTFLVPKPTLFHGSTFIFQPLTKELWFIIIILTISSAVFLHLVAKFYLKVTDKQHAYLSISLAILDLIQSFASGSLTYFPRESYSRLRFILTIICIQTLLLTTGYYTGYASILTKPIYNKPIKSYADMIDQRIYWGGVDNTLQILLRHDPNVIIRKLAKFYLKEPVGERNERIHKNNYSLVVRSMDNSFITDIDTLDDYGKTHLKIVPQCFMTNYIVFPLKRNSPFTLIFNKYITSFLEHGLIQHWYKEICQNHGLNYMEQFYTYSVSTIASKKALSLNKLQGAFYILLCGYIVAFLMLIFELTLNCFKRIQLLYINN